MGYRKFRSGQLFTGREILSSNAVMIMNEAGIVEDVVSLADAGDDVQFLEGMITPGFINTHCHIELSHMKGRIPERTGLVPFLTSVIRERNVPAEIIRSSMQEAEAELYNSGTVAVGDICNTTDSLNLKEESKIQWRNFIEVLGFTQTGGQERIDRSANILAAFQQRLGLRSDASLTPHAPYSVSETLFQLINDASVQQMITIHNQESEAENLLYREGRGSMYELYKNLGIDPSFFTPAGKSSLQTYLPWLNKARSLMLVHNCFCSREDIRFAQQQFPANLYFCICMHANLYIDDIVPPLLLLRECNTTLTLGTDSYASNRQLNMLEEIKAIQQEFDKAIPLSEILQWATLNGAQALQMDHSLGSFEPGKQPGVVWIDKVEEGVIADDAVARRIL